jgi:hypothetical protein
MDKDPNQYGYIKISNLTIRDISLCGTVKDRIPHLLVTKLEEPETEIKKFVCGMEILAWLAKAKQVIGRVIIVFCLM